MSQAQLPANIQDAITLIEYAAKGTVKVENALNQLLDQHAARTEGSKLLDQQIAEARNKLEQAQTHLTQTVINMLKLGMQP